ncbi:2-isopropylmalate synthase A-like protein [Tanacetum coccineum]
MLMYFNCGAWVILAGKVAGEAGGEVGLAGNGGVSGEEGVHVAVICGLARCNKNDIDKAWEAVKYAKYSRIHTFIATSEIRMVACARNLGCNDVTFSPEDARRRQRPHVNICNDEIDTCDCSLLNSRKLKIKGRVPLHLSSSAGDSNGTYHRDEKEPYVEKFVVEE